MQTMNPMNVSELFNKFKSREIERLEEQHVRGQTFYFQTDDKGNWAWSLMPVPPKQSALTRPDGLPFQMYGSVFYSVEEMASALAKFTRGSYEVCWIGSLGDTVRECTIYCDGAIYRWAVDKQDALEVAKELASATPTHTWVVRPNGDNVVVGVFRFPVREDSDVSGTTAVA